MTEITKESLFNELVERVRKQLEMIRKIEEKMNEAYEDAELLTSLTKSYNNIVSLYNQTTANLIQIKKWNYSDKEEKEKELLEIRKLISQNNVDETLKKYVSDNDDDNNNNNDDDDDEE